MGRLATILNGILAPFGKTLWSGDDFTSGNITVPGADKYAAYAVTISGTVCLALKDGNTVSVYGVSASTVAASAQQFIKAAVFSISGDTWTLVRAKQTNHNETTTAHSLSSTTMQVTKIVGLIPNWGGYCIAVFSTISAIFTDWRWRHEQIIKDIGRTHSIGNGAAFFIGMEQRLRQSIKDRGINRGRHCKSETNNSNVWICGRGYTSGRRRHLDKGILHWISVLQLRRICEVRGNKDHGRQGAIQYHEWDPRLWRLRTDRLRVAPERGCTA